MSKIKSLTRPNFLTKNLSGLALILGVLIMSFLVGYLVFAWVEPTLPPPQANVPAPINIGSVEQWKIGGIGVGSTTPLITISDGQIAANSFYDTDSGCGAVSGSWYLNPSGTSVLCGSVGIGTTGPNQKLSVAGTLGILEGGASPSFYTIFQGGDQTANITYTLPTAYPSASGQVLSSTTTGAMSWATAGAGVTWPLLAPDGTAAAPSYSFSNDPDMGIYRGGIDILRFVTAGTDRVTINAAGNVGIGTTTIPTGVKLYSYRPSGDYGANKASVYGYRYGGTGGATQGGTGWTVDTVDAAVKGYSWYGNQYTAGVAGYNYSDWGLSAGVIGGSWAGGTYWGALGFKDSAGLFWGVYTPSNTYLGGNVGIGTTPSYKLDVSGTVNMTSFRMPTGAVSGYVLTSDASGIGTWQAAAAGGIGGNGTATQVAFFTITPNTIGSDSNLYWHNTNKWLGIGTATPASVLDISAGTGTIILRSTTAGADSNIYFKSMTDGGASWDTSLILADAATGGSTPSLRFNIIDADGLGWDTGLVIRNTAAGDDFGNVGIGTTGPSQKLDVVGNIEIDSWDSQLRQGYATGNPTPYIRRSIGGAHGWDSNMLYINGWNDWSSGVSIGGPGGTSNLTVTGNLTVNGTGGNVCHNIGGSWYSCPAGGTGTVTSISQGTGITASPNPIITTGIINLDTTYTDNRYVNVTGDTMSGNLTVNGEGTFSSGKIKLWDQGIELRNAGGTPYVDFSNDASIDYDMRIILAGDDQLNIDGGNLTVGGVVSATGYNNTSPAFSNPVRALNTWYQNTTGKTITVYLTVNVAGAGTSLANYARLHVGPLTTDWQMLGETSNSSITQNLQLYGHVPNNYYYRVLTGGTINILGWKEAPF